MKRFLTLFWLALAAPTLAQTVQVDGRPLALEAPPVRMEGRLLVPLRGIFEALGATVSYREGIIQARRGSRQVDVLVGSPRAVVDGRSVSLETPPRLLGGRTYVPLRFVAEALGARVAYDASAGRVSIQTSAGSGAGGVGAPSGGVGDLGAPSGGVNRPAGAYPGDGNAPSNASASSAAWSAVYSFRPEKDLRRIRVGNQAGILKVMDPSNQREAYYRALDDRGQACYTPAQRAAIFSSLGVSASATGAAAGAVMDNYARLPHREALAFLGGLGSEPGLEEGARGRIQEFVAGRMLGEVDVTARRQAVLALALMDRPDPATVERVLQLYERSDNLWETFPVQMFFQFHSGEIRRMAGFAQVRARVAGVNSLYTPYILQYLDSGSSAGL